MPENRVGVTDQAAGAGVAEVRVRQRLVGGSNVEEQFVIQQRERVVQAGFVCNSGLLTPPAALHSVASPLAGFFALINPVGSAVMLAFRRAEFTAQATAATAMPTFPRIHLERFTFTGTLSGAQLTPAPMRTAQSARVGLVPTVLTGLTTTYPSPAQVVWGFPLAVTLGTTWVGTPYMPFLEWEPDDDGMVILAAGEGIICRQTDAGTASDNRRIMCNFGWEEFTLP